MFYFCASPLSYTVDKHGIHYFHHCFRMLGHFDIFHICTSWKALLQHNWKLLRKTFLKKKWHMNNYTLNANKIGRMCVFLFLIKPNRAWRDRGSMIQWRGTHTCWTDDFSGRGRRWRVALLFSPKGKLVEVSGATAAKVYCAEQENS